jgi:type IV pilus assembly protein PilB
MVGEIRDPETSSLATHAALTGHIVLSTIHTNNAIGVIPRLVDLGIQSYLIPPTLSLAIAQRLVRRLCPHCREKVEAKGEAEKLISKELGSLPEKVKKDLKIKSPFYIFKPGGCKKCRGKGYVGRIAVVEVLKMTDQLAEIVLKEPSEVEIAKEARRQGMVTMRQDGILKAFAGVTSIEEVLRVAAEV